MTETPKPGEVWEYPYLWARQMQQGETEGRKHRPCVVAVLLQLHNAQTGVVFLAITSQRPGPKRQAIEVPETECKRAGLTTDRPLWIILDEHNQDRVETSYYLEPDARIGAFGPRFLSDIQRQFLNAIKDRNAVPVRRND